MLFDTTNLDVALIKKENEERYRLDRKDFLMETKNDSNGSSIYEQNIQKLKNTV
jgi:hypothetical protein